MGVSNHLVGLLNFLSMLVSIPILGAGIWLAVKNNTECLRYLQGPIIAIGVLIFLISVAGLIGSCCRVTWLLFLYLAAMLLIIIALFSVTVFVLVVTSQGSGEHVTGRQYQEYQLNKYTKWFQNEVSKAGNWRTVKACIRDSKVCQKLNYTDSQHFYSARLSPLQSGCCKPPTACNFAYVNATNWSAPTAAFDGNTYSDESDCKSWSNDQSQLCYDCNSCKAGVIENIRLDWRKVAIVNVVVLIVLIIIYSLGCCAFRNNRRVGLYEKRPAYWRGS